ncbi:MAG: DUF3172 domain-containing protein [Leptolyngbyaceae cyanobacterium SM1_1_3]|nr:DUF3172 domain-containing protein [Leptolyngbyaceae cyanobacterium SM1_1_3]NJN01910.1 DUF3172 domain-containing protein [Leptolyngbyaceae cyanobacterium RM1_1_2]NJO10899.1 DUF3172 domain-containing protein [Leptolyngbyaceae cyanobacterium SL_1_1]
MNRKTSRYAPPAEPSRIPGNGGKGPFNYLTVAVLGGIFILGIALGIVFSSSASFSPENIASREAIDRSAPNPELCARYGASAVVSDMRVFLTFNPFNVYLSQPRMQPGCVIRRNNWAILEQRDLVTSTDVRQCRNRMNTFGYTGDIGDKPAIDCIYQNDGAGNLFLNQPGFGAPPPESEQF